MPGSRRSLLQMAASTPVWAQGAKPVFNAPQKVQRVELLRRTRSLKS